MKNIDPSELNACELILYSCIKNAYKEHTLPTIEDGDLEEFINCGDHPNGVYPLDELSEFRTSGESCNLSPLNYSRHFEVDCCVCEIDGKWVAWDYYYGGGKYADPDSVPWLDDARFVVVEKEIVVKQRIFAEIEKQ